MLVAQDQALLQAATAILAADSWLCYGLTDSLMAARWLAVPLLLLASVLPTVTAVEGKDAARAPLLITAFGPFDGRGVNGSATILPQLSAALQAESLVLPVRWAALASELPAAIKRHSPAILIGLGEGHPGSIALELRAHNQAQGVDVDNHRAPQWLGPSVELWRDSRLPADAAALLAALPAAGTTSYPLTLSTDAGAYLCNAWLWHALTPAYSADTVCFIHLPPQGERSDEEYIEQVLPSLQALLTIIVDLTHGDSRKIVP